MTWLQLRLDTSAEQAPRAEDAMLALGAASVTLQDNADQPLFAQDHPTQELWRETRVSGLFPADADVNELSSALCSSLGVDAASALRAEILEDKDWEREWMQHYAPLQFADTLWLCPSWMSPPDPDATNIMLDPGLAFGTGTHPTTAMCMAELAAVTPPGGQVVDFGCGSGVLGIAALLLGAEHVLATDTDPRALSATWANAERNNVAAGRLTVCHPERLSGREKADLVVANILAGPLCELAGQLCKMLKPGGRLLLSGILASQLEMLQAAYPIPLTVARQQDGWLALTGLADE